jgi:hypothetical protein
MDKLLALVTALLAAIERYLPTVAAYFAGKGVVKGEQQKEALRQAKAEQAFTQSIDALHAALDDDGLHDLATARAERLRLRLKARAVDSSGGKDD